MCQEPHVNAKHLFPRHVVPTHVTPVLSFRRLVFPSTTSHARPASMRSVMHAFTAHESDTCSSLTAFPVT